MKKTKIVFAGHDLKFAKLIMQYLDESGLFEIREDQWNGHNVHDEQISMDCLNWADIIVCEWGLGNAVWYSQRKLPHQKLIVRMHLQEVDTIYPKQFELDNIDAFIAISPYIYEEFYRVFKLPREKMRMIYNVLDTEALNKSKIEDSKYHLGMIGIAPKRKRLDLALDLLEKLWSKDQRYKLFVKGKMPQEYPWLWNKEEEREYYESQFNRIEKAPWKDAVVFEGFGDVSEWFTKIGFILSTSDFESFHLAPSEGMASGALPLILNWEGSETIYKKEYLYTDIDAFANKVLEVNSLKDSNHLRESVKGYVQQFSVKQIGDQWLALIEELLNEENKKKLDEM